jgi:microcystin-dependent protein
LRKCTGQRKPPDRAGIFVPFLALVHFPKYTQRKNPMPRNGSGVYSLPAGYLATTGQSATASQHNTPLEDIASEITASVPIAGTKAMSGNLQMGTNKITGMGDGSSAQDGATMANLAAWVPAGVIVPYGGTSAPTGWLLCYGQSLSRTTYATLYAAIGTTYGSVDGDSFSLPDLRGRVVAGQDDMGGSSANRLTNASGGLDGDTLGATGGAETHTLTEAQLPAHTHTATVTDPGHFHTTSTQVRGTSTTNQFGGTGQGIAPITPSTDTATTGITVSNANTGSGSAHNNVQPTIILNYIIRT